MAKDRNSMILASRYVNQATTLTSSSKTIQVLVFNRWPLDLETQSGAEPSDKFSAMRLASVLR